MVINPYLVVILFYLCIYFPSLKCLIIVDDIRQFGAIKDLDFFKNLTWKNFLQTRLYGGGTFWTFETCPTCKGTKKTQIIKVNPTQPTNCPTCRASGKIEWRRRFFGNVITGVQIDHAFSMFLMCVIGVLMYADFHSILGKRQAVLACLLFASSSLVTHIGVWLNGRRYALNIIFILGAILCIHAGGYWIILATVLYGITPFFHMTAFFAPVLYPLSIPFMIIITALFWKQIDSKVMGRLNAIYDACDRRHWNWNKWRIIVKTYGFYFFKMLFPRMTRTCYGFLYMWGETPEGNKDAYAFNRDFYIGVVSLIATCVVVFYLPHGFKMYGVFMALATLQWCNIINATQVVADRYACMPYVFMCVLIAYLLPWYAVAVLVGVNVAFTSQCYRMYENVEGMFDYHFYHWPNITMVNKEYISYCIKQGNYIKASAIVTRCLQFNPTDFALLHAACVCARVANDRVIARKFLEIAEKHLYIGQEDVQRRWMDNFKASL